jgi:hypothetical protein
MDDWWQTLERLAEKYRELVGLCEDREVLEGKGVHKLEGEEREARHGRTRRLAERFPGALRELEGATTVGLLQRLQAVEEELALRRGREAAPRWMRIVDEFHAELRELLAIKGAKGRGETVTPEELERISEPPYGRLQELVWTRLAERHGLTPEELRGVVHGGQG